MSPTPVFPDPEDFAYILDADTGEYVDTVYNFDSAISYIQDLEHVAIAARDWLWYDGTLRATKAELQEAFNDERRLQEDCFGLEPLDL